MGRYNLFAQKTIANTAAPGTLIKSSISGRIYKITDIMVWNKDASSAATITFYNEDSDIYLVIRLSADEMGVISLSKPIVYEGKDIYARTSSSSGAEVTITGEQS